MDKEEKNETVEEIEETEEEVDELEDNEEFTYTLDNNGTTTNNNYNKNSYIYILAGFIILIIIIITLVVVVNGKSKKISNYSDVESRLVSAAKKYYDKYPEQLPQMENVAMSIDAEKLIQNSFLKPFSEMVKDDVECTGQVKVYKNDEIYSYFPYLNCGTSYKSEKLKDKIIDENLVTDGNGLYRINNEYIYRGEFPNNYVKFNNETWRIVRINNDGTIKMVLTEKKPEKIEWDDRYNNERSSYTGKNDFKISRVNDELKKLYDENKYVNKENKELLVKGTWCIGKVPEDGIEISNLNLCNDTYENLYIGLLTIEDVLVPSLDNTCVSVFDGACTNYNYFEDISVGWTMTAGLNKTYTVFTANQASLEVKNASSNNTIRPVININSDTLYKSGNGTEKDPYIIGK